MKYKRLNLKTGFPVILMLLVLLLFSGSGCGDKANGTDEKPVAPKYVNTKISANSARPNGRITPDTGKAARSKLKVCLDPGHPSEVNSAKTLQNGTTENHINWVVACLLRDKLKKMGYEVVMTKEAENQLVTNKQRALIANRSKSAFMLRLHCDTGAGSGFTFYYPDRAGKKGSKTGPPPLIRIKSKELAESLCREMGSKIGVLHSRGALSEIHTLIGSRQGALTGSIFATVPVVTLEMCYLSNKVDAEFIKSKSGQELLAAELATAIETYSRNRDI